MKSVVEQERFNDPIKNEYRMNCMSALLFIDHFVHNRKVPMEKLLTGLSVGKK